MARGNLGKEIAFLQRVAKHSQISDHSPEIRNKIIVYEEIVRHGSAVAKNALIARRDSGGGYRLYTLELPEGFSLTEYRKDYWFLDCPHDKTSQFRAQKLSSDELKQLLVLEEQEEAR